MKKALSIFLVVALVISLFPAQVFAQETSVLDMEILDTYVYDLMRSENGIFESLFVTIVYTYSDGSVAETNEWLYSCFVGGGSDWREWRTTYSNFVVCRDNQDVAPWEVGNTYQIAYGDEKSFNVEVREMGISAIEIEDATWCYHANDQGKFTYPLCFTVHFKDGTSSEQQGAFGYTVNWTGWSTDLNLEDGQEEEPWVLGETYEVTGSICGVSDTFNVTVVTVEDIEVKDVEVWENTDGQWTGNWDDNGNYIENAYYLYWANPNQCTVYFTDGSFVTGTINELEELHDLQLHYWSDQSAENQWGVGSHSATIECGGFQTSYTVTVLSTTVENIVVEDVYRREGYNYSFLPEQMTITFDDGHIISGSYDDVRSQLPWNINIECSSDLSESNQWEAGTHRATLKLYDYETQCTMYETQYNVIVQEGPVKEIQVIKMPDKTEYLTGEYVDLTGAVIRIQYQDGSSEDIAFEYYSYSGYSRYFEKAVLYGVIQAYQIVTAGSQNVRIELLGKYFEIPIVAKENQMESISIQENPDGTLTITVSNGANASYDMKVLDLSHTWRGPFILTDIGVYYGWIVDYEDSFAIKLKSCTGEYIESNRLYDRAWLESNRYLESVYSALGSFIVQQKGYRFTGTLTADNIDAIIYSALLLSSSWHKDYISNDDWNNRTFQGDVVKKAIGECFAVDSIDLTLSENYDAQTDTCQLPMRVSDIQKVSPAQTSYNNGVLSIKVDIRDNMSYSDTVTLNIKLDDNNRIISFAFNTGVQPGDADGDAELTDWDGVVVARYLAGWNVTIADEAALDVDGDGAITDWDGVILDRYLAGWNVQIG